MLVKMVAYTTCQLILERNFTTAEHTSFMVVANLI